MKATLILANGSVFSGTSIGGTSDRICEMVFNTSMTGYQEILTDPSYAGQGIVMSYPPHRQLRRQSRGQRIPPPLGGGVHRPPPGPARQQLPLRGRAGFLFETI